MADSAASLATWFTPSSFFILVNLVIGTIAIISRFAAPKRKSDEPQLVRSPSLLDRVRSFNLRHYNHYDAQPEPQLVRTPSLLERVRSFRLGQYNHYDAQPEPQLVRTPSLLERVRSFNSPLYEYAPTRAETEHDQPHQPESERPCPNPGNPQLVRTPSLLQRLRSMSFSSREQEPESEGPDSNPGRDSGHAEMRKSASERAGSVKCECEEDEEAVERRRPATTRAETTLSREDEEVDAKADDFINRFKKQLRLQRVDSILRYREMLRGN